MALFRISLHRKCFIVFTSIEYHLNFVALSFSLYTSFSVYCSDDCKLYSPYTVKLCHELHHCKIEMLCWLLAFFLTICFSHCRALHCVQYVRWNGQARFYTTIPKTISDFSRRHGENFLISKSKAQIFYNVVTESNTIAHNYLNATRLKFCCCLETSLPNQLPIYNWNSQLNYVLNWMDFFHSPPACRTYRHKRYIVVKYAATAAVELFILMERVMIFSFEIVNRIRFNVQVYLMW